MLTALSSAITGLESYQEQMDVIGNNIANVDTTAFKAGVVDFADALTISGFTIPALSTRRAVANGAVESNGLLSNPNGSVSWGRVVGLKAGFCGVSAAMQETHVFGLYNTPKSDWTWTAVNAGASASSVTWLSTGPMYRYGMPSARML